jgi:TRAP-type C4-dicarboxylate transport system permease small subunit
MQQETRMGGKRPGPILSAYWAALDATGVACGIAVGLICIGICADVIVRLIGGGAIPWMLESIEYLQYAVVLTGATWVLCHGAHVSLDILVVLLSPRWQARMQRVACVVGFAACAVFAAASFAATADTWNMGGTIYKSITLPEWGPLAFLPAGFALMSVEFLLQFLGYARPRERASL